MMLLNTTEKKADKFIICHGTEEIIKNMTGLIQH